MGSGLEVALRQVFVANSLCLLDPTHYHRSPALKAPTHVSPKSIGRDLDRHLDASAMPLIRTKRKLRTSLSDFPV